MRRIAILALAAALASCATPAPPAPPPPCALQVDGMLDEPIWTAAQRIDMGGGATLLLLQAPDHLCLGIDTRNAPRRYVDLFLQDGSHISHNFHASMQVGERRLPNGRWTDESPETSWGQTTGWTANAAATLPTDTHAPSAEQIAPLDGYEFVIERAPMARPWRLRVEVRDFQGQARDIVWPAQSRRTDVLSWALLQ